VSGGGVVVSVASPVVVGGDELVGAESELVDVRAARAAALTRSTELARAGNDVAASNAARAARDFATAARALAGEVALLRESDVRLTESQGEMLARALRDFSERLALPWAASVRELLSATIRRAAGREVPDIDRTAGRAADELRKHFAALLAAEAPALGRIDTEAAPNGVKAELRSSGDGIPSDPLGAEPKPAPPLAHVRGEAQGAGEVVDAPEDEPLVLCDPGDVPAAWLTRFELGADGRERCRRAFSEHLRDQQRKREAAVAAAEDERRERAKAAAAQRAARDADRGPAPQGWDSGAGVGGGRRISHLGRERAG
jgi:hypothetical protein